jgi:hypothetical protein
VDATAHAQIESASQVGLREMSAGRTRAYRLRNVGALATVFKENSITGPCFAQLERTLELTGKHNRALSELEERVGFAEERGKDTRGRLERLEDGERSLQVRQRGFCARARRACLYE